MQFYDYQKCVTDDVENYLIDCNIDLEHSNLVPGIICDLALIK